MKEYIIQNNITGTLITYKSNKNLTKSSSIVISNSYRKGHYRMVEDITDLSSFNLTQTRI